MIHVTEYENEPIPGLPGNLPPGERILWQGKPEWRSLARTAFHTRLIAVYFAVLFGFASVSAMIDGGYIGVMMTAILGVVGVALLHLLAWGTARATVYTLTDRRVVLRVGIALPKCINLPLTLIGNVDLNLHADGHGDVALDVRAQQKMGYLTLWPHARAWHVASPQPMFRAVPDAATVGALVARTCLAANPQGQIATVEAHAPAQQTMTGAVAA